MKIVWTLVVAVIVIGGGWYYWSTQSSRSGEQVETGGPAAVDSTMPAMGQTVVVTYTDEGFSPAEVTIPAGSTITWVNESKSKMWVASAMHPTHTAYDNSALSEHCKDGVASSTAVFDACAGVDAGSSWSFTFDKVGSWKYHDHITSGRFGTIIVTEAAPEMIVNDEDAAAL